MLEASRFLIREQTHHLPSQHSYEILDGDTGERLGQAEEVLSGWSKFFRWFTGKRLSHTLIEVREEPDQALVFTISCGSYLFRPRIEVQDAVGSSIGYFQEKFFSVGRCVRIYDPEGQPLAEVRSDVLGYNYTLKLPDSAVELGRVSKQWNGLLRELFTDADRFTVEFAPDLEGQPLMKMLLLASALVTDLIYHTRYRR